MVTSTVEREGKISKMTFQELAVLINDEWDGDELSEVERMIVNDRLGNLAWGIGRLLDRTHDIDPLKTRGALPRYGTPNKRSYTYKLRKAVGFSYP